MFLPRPPLWKRYPATFEEFCGFQAIFVRYLVAGQKARKVALQAEGSGVAD